MIVLYEAILLCEIDLLLLLSYLFSIHLSHLFIISVISLVINNTKIITLYNNNKCNRGGRVGDASLSSASDQ